MLWCELKELSNKISNFVDETENCYWFRGIYWQSGSFQSNVIRAASCLHNWKQPSQRPQKEQLENANGFPMF